jgi:hypothetical protein
MFFDSQLQRFYSMVGWPCCLWTCGEAEHYGRECGVENAVHLTEARKAREKGRDLVIDGMPSIT